MGLHRVSLRVWDINTRVIACYRACGFVEEGREREQAFVDGVWCDDVIMGCLATDVQQGLAGPDDAGARAGCGADAGSARESPVAPDAKARSCHPISQKVPYATILLPHLALCAQDHCADP